MRTALVHCCSPRLHGGRCFLEWTLLTLFERYLASVVFLELLRHISNHLVLF
jgi:hypothetical protein